MARTVRSPMETRTPVRTISSVMRNAPRQVFTPQRVDRGFGRKNPISSAVESTFAPARETRPVAPITSVSRPAASAVTSTVKAPVARKTTTAIRPASPAVKSAGSKTVTPKATTPATKPITSTTKPTTKAPVKSVTSTTTKPAVSPITSKTNTPATPAKKTSGSSGNVLSSVLNNPIGKTLLGAGAGALAGKIFGGKTTTGGTTGGTRPAGIPTTGGGTRSPTTGGTTKPTTKPTTGGATAGSTTGNTSDIYQYPTNPSGGTPYDDEGNLMPGWQLDENNNPVWVGYPDSGTSGVTGGTGDASGTRSIAGTGGDTTGDTTVASTDGMTDLGEGYYQDASGNIYSASGDLMYTVGANGEYFDPNGELIYDPNADTAVADNTWTDPDTGQVWNMAEDGTWSMEGGDTTVADNTWTDPDSGQTWTMADDGSWSLEGDNTTYEDYTVADNTDYSYDDGGDYEVKKGGSIHQKTKHGVPRFEDGGYSDTTEEVQPWQNVDYNYGEFDEPGWMAGEYALGYGGGRNNTYLRNSPVALSDLTEGDSSSSGAVTNVDLTGGSDFTPVPGRQYFDDGSYIDTFDDGSTMTYDTEGNLVGTTEGYQTSVDDYGNTVVTDGYGNMTVYDPNGNLIPPGGGRVTSAGSGTKPSFASQLYNSVVGGGNQNQSGILDALKGYITENPGLAGGAIGALLASMMNDSGGGGSSQAPVDISQLAAFAPRTTDFGPGMVGGRTGTGSPIVSYQDYAEGYGEEVPDERLYSDLGISGWLNEPEMTDYVDEGGNTVDQYGNYLDNESPSEDNAEVAEEPSMAAGGATTHYTFGRVIDPAQNLGVAQGMKKGGLSQAHTVHSHQTNPVIDDRVDFRRGSAVNGAGDGQSDDIPAWLADGEYVIDAELVSMLGNGSNKAGAKVLDKFREEVRNHKRSAPLNKIPPKAKSPLNYLKEAMNG